MNTLLRRLNHLRPTRFAGVAEVLVLLVPALLLWWLAYQAPAPLTLHIGGDVERFRREDDAPFLTGVNASEPDSDTTWRWWELLTDGYPYRWTNAETQVDYPGAGGRRWLVEILARGGRPDGTPTTGTWQAGDTTLELQLVPGPPRRYRLLADSNAAGDLMLRLDSEAFSPPGDPRELGFVLHEIRFLPTRTGNNAAVAQLGWLALIVAMAYLSARRLTGRTTALIFATGLVIAATYSLTWYRPALTIFSPVLALLTLSSAGLALAVDVGLQAAGVQGYRPILALITLGFVLRMAGMVHPHALFSDATFNANNLLRVALGQIQLSAGLPSEAGGGSAPYPPGLYVLLLPAQLLSGSDTVPRRLLVQAGTALLDSGVIGLIWLTLSRAGLGQPAALFGAACYLLPIPALESFSIGEYANLGGQALALPAVALLALGAANRKHWRQTALLSTALAIGLLGHSGVTLSTRGTRGIGMDAGAAPTWARYDRSVATCHRRGGGDQRGLDQLLLSAGLCRRLPDSGRGCHERHVRRYGAAPDRAQHRAGSNWPRSAGRAHASTDRAQPERHRRPVLAPALRTKPGKRTAHRSDRLVDRRTAQPGPVAHRRPGATLGSVPLSRPLPECRHLPRSRLETWMDRSVGRRHNPGNDPRSRADHADRPGARLLPHLKSYDWTSAKPKSRASLWKRKNVLVFGGIAAKNQYIFSLARLRRATRRRKGRLCSSPGSAPQRLLRLHERLPDCIV
jgi:hypothetical protein